MNCRIIAAFAALLVLAACSGGGGGGSGTSAAGIGEQPVVGAHFNQAQIESGQVPLDDVLVHGAALFNASFNTLDGAGRPETTGTGASRVRRIGHDLNNRLSGNDSNSCAGCHNIPRSGGGGDNVANVFVLAQALPFVNFDGGEGDGFANLDLDTVANERNTPGMWGSGFIELLAREMTVALQAIRDDAIAQALLNVAPVTMPLMAKGVSFGAITANADGTVDSSAVSGVDADLIIKPFHQKGVVISLREFTNNAMNHHHGIQSTERFGAGDADADGVANELTEGDITAATLWQAVLAVPGRVLPDDPTALAAVAQGEALFNGAAGCATCHTPFLELDDPIFTEPNPFNPAGNLTPADVGQVVSVDLTEKGFAPRLSREANGKVRIPAYSDLKRYDMGPGLTEPKVQAGVAGNLFITKKLWGFASEPPYMHHGRATTITEAIEMHGGDAQTSRNAFVALSQGDKDALIAFLKTLRVLPPNASSTEQTESFSGTIGEEGAIKAHISQADINNGIQTATTLFEAGRLLFAANFNTLDGQGRPESTGTGAPRARREAPQNFNRISGPDSNSCAGCHNLPGPGGGGDNVANVFVLAQAKPFVNFDGLEGDDFDTSLTLETVGNERNTPGMWGAGFIELLAREMTVDLQAQRAAAIQSAQTTLVPVTAALASKGVSFGSIIADPSGSVDASGVVGVDQDLVIKPFHQKGVVVSLREFSNNAMNHHHGIQSAERFGTGVDADNDGVVNELTEGDVTAVTLYQALLRVPGRLLPSDPARVAAVAEGEMLFNGAIGTTGIGCANCHTPALRLESPVFTEPNPFNPVGNLAVTDVPQPFAVDLTQAGPAPRLSKQMDGSVMVPAYTDMKRWDMGAESAEPLVQAGVGTSVFLTKKLWGFSSEPPFMSHGHATTITEAIHYHGGDGAASRDAFEALDAAQRASVIEFLKTLQVLPEGSPQTVTQ